MEMNILYLIQSLRFPELDKIMVLIFSNIVGDKGQIWIYLGIIALIFPKTRKYGKTMLISYLLSYFLCDNILKDLFARLRPCAIDETIELLVKRSSSYSMPSVHSAIAFASAMSVYLKNHKLGILFLIFAAMVALSRLYFFVHFPTDVLAGAIIGMIIAYIVDKIFKQ